MKKIIDAIDEEIRTLQEAKARLLNLPNKKPRTNKNAIQVRNTNSYSLTKRLQEILDEFNRPMTAEEVQREAEKRGAKGYKPHSYGATLSHLVIRNQTAIRLAPGIYASINYKRG